MFHVHFKVVGGMRATSCAYFIWFGVLKIYFDGKPYAIYKNMIKFKIVFMPFFVVVVAAVFSLSYLFVLCYAMLTWYIYLVCSFIHSFHLERNFFISALDQSDACCDV